MKKALLAIALITISFNSYSKSSISINVGIPKTQGLWMETRGINEFVDLSISYDIRILDNYCIEAGIDSWARKKDNSAGTPDTAVCFYLMPNVGFSYSIPLSSRININNQVTTGPAIDIRSYKDSTIVISSWFISYKIANVILLNNLRVIAPYVQYDVPLFNFIDKKSYEPYVEIFQFVKFGIGVSFDL